MFKGTVSEGSALEVTFKADHSNNGPAGFFFGYVPRGGSGEEHASFTPVAPGGSHAIESTVPSASDVWSLRLRIDVPDEQGSGRLVVTENGEESDNAAITKDTSWTYAVSPSD
jgi:hypothetical protein